MTKTSMYIRSSFASKVHLKLSNLYELVTI